MYRITTECVRSWKARRLQKERCGTNVHFRAFQSYNYENRLWFKAGSNADKHVHYILLLKLLCIVLSFLLMLVESWDFACALEMKSIKFRRQIDNFLFMIISGCKCQSHENH